ncbi:MAG: hypothetical protein AAF914_04410, partial [Pseudomonadota bacterium]
PKARGAAMAVFTIPSLAGFFAGLASGVLIAMRRRGNAADMAQYGAVFGIIGFVIGVMISLIVPAAGA